MCRRIGCDSHPHVSCAVGNCVTHCTSPRCQHPSTRPRRRRRVRRATEDTVPVPQSRDSPVLPPSLSSSHVPSAAPSDSFRSAAIRLADHPLGLFVDVVAVRSQCTLSAPRDTLQIPLPQRPLQFPSFLVGKRRGGDCSVDGDVVIPRFPLRTFQHPSSVECRWHCPRSVSRSVYPPSATFHYRRVHPGDSCSGFCQPP